MQKNHSLRAGRCWLSIAIAGLIAPQLGGAKSLETARLNSVEPAQTIFFKPDDGPDLRAALATLARPSERQMHYQELEYTGFIHFGPNTFRGVEWGDGKEDPALFNPPQVDTDQWCKVARAAGMKQLMITIKHHDGYCTWQTRYNREHSVAQSPWKNGRGDVLRNLTRSAKKYGLKVGVYISPADLYQIESENGLYGNLSKYRESVIPTDPARFQTDPMRGRTPPPRKPTFCYKVDDYNRYMLNQLYEVLTEYGPIHEVWFDGAHPKRKGGQTYTYQFWYEMIRVLAPNAVIAIKGNDVRWCGNESGRTRSAEWSPTPMQGSFEEFKQPNIMAADIGSRKKLQTADYVHWWVNEVDVSIRHGWFWRDEKQSVRSAEEIYDLYERCCGGNSVLLLNVPPNRNGRFSERDVRALLAAGKRIRATYGQPAAQLIQNGSIYSLDRATTINRIVLREPIQTGGQRVEEHAVDAWVDGRWKQIAHGETIGYKKILRVADVKTDRIRVRILKSRREASLSSVSVHRDSPPLSAPKIVRNRTGELRIEDVGNASVHYTLDGSEPNAQSPRYTAPLALPCGANVRAICVRGTRCSAISNRRFDLSKSKWRIQSVSSESPATHEGAQRAIDETPNTLWRSRWKGATDSFPHQLTIDFGEDIAIKGFSYLPRANHSKGAIDRYRVELSSDGTRWTSASEGRFDNMENDPTQRDILFSHEYPTIRYLRFSGLHSVGGKSVSATAEIGVITR